MREKMKISENQIEDYCFWLCQSEKSSETVKKYYYYLNMFREFVGNNVIKKQEVLAWREYLRHRFSPVTVNSALAAINGFLRHMGWDDCRVRFLKIRRRIFCAAQRELSKPEYRRLVEEAYACGNERIAMILQTVCSTGIRISELRYITVEAVEKGVAEVDCKGKVRTVFLTRKLCQMLREYIGKNNILSGMVFVTRTGRAMDRSNIWREMKNLAVRAGVACEKVFPHNLRHLFARCFYDQEKDLLRLSDILGHSSINTTRIYTMESGEKHIREMENLGLLVGDYNRVTLLL